jgi:hypothetical protein
VTNGDVSDRWEVQFDQELRTPSRMTNRALEDETASGHVAVTDSLAEAAAFAVFEENPLWFHLRRGIDSFRIVRSIRNGWLRELQLEQTYQGVPVAGAGYQMRVLPSGRVGTLSGRFHPNIVIDVSPVLDGSQAEDRARAAYPPGATPQLPQLLLEDFTRSLEPRRLIVLPEPGRYRLAWAVRIRTDQGFTRVYVDARTSELIGAQYLGTYER